MELMSRRRLVSTGATASIAAAVVGSTSVFAQAGQPQVGKWLINLEFAFDPSTLDNGGATRPTPATLTPGPFYIAGPVYASGSLNPDGTAKSDAVVRGYHRFFGWILDVPAMQVVGTHTFDLAGRGKLVTNTSSDGLSAPISGGTGDFRHAYGEVRVGIINRQNGAYRLVVDASSPTVGM